MPSRIRVLAVISVSAGLGAALCSGIVPNAVTAKVRHELRPRTLYTLIESPNKPDRSYWLFSVEEFGIFTAAIGDRYHISEQQRHPGLFGIDHHFAVTKRGNEDEPANELPHDLNRATDEVPSDSDVNQIIYYTSGYPLRAFWGMQMWHDPRVIIESIDYPDGGPYKAAHFMAPSDFRGNRRLLSLAGANHEGVFHWPFFPSGVRMGRFAVNTAFWSLAAMAAGVLVVGSIKFIYLIRRISTGRCLRCGYSVAGLQRCPECGEVVIADAGSSVAKESR